MAVEKEYQLIFTCRVQRPLSAPTALDLYYMEHEARAMCQVVQFRTAALDETAIANAAARGLQLQEYVLDPKDFCNTGNGYIVYTCMQDERGHPIRGDIEHRRVYSVDYTFYIRELVPVELERLEVFA